MNVENDRYTLSSSEMRTAVVTSFLAAVLLNAFIMVMMKRLLQVPAPLSAALGFVAFSLPMFLPLRLIQARRNVHLTWRKFLIFCAFGAVVAGMANVLLDHVWP